MMRSHVSKRLLVFCKRRRFMRHCDFLDRYLFFFTTIPKDCGLVSKMEFYEYHKNEHVEEGR